MAQNKGQSQPPEKLPDDLLGRVVNNPDSVKHDPLHYLSQLFGACSLFTYLVVYLVVYTVPVANPRMAPHHKCTRVELPRRDRNDGY
jgi:hypothetical protein